MVYLVRTARMLKYSEEFGEATSKLDEHFKKNYPEIKESKMLWNITGAIDESHWVLTFDSLADEDKWAGAVMQDEVYRDWFTAADGVMGPMVDKLYRDSPM